MNNIYALASRMCPVCLGVLFLAVLFRAVLLPVWSMDQQPHHHLQACQTHKFMSSPRLPANFYL